MYSTFTCHALLFAQSVTGGIYAAGLRCAVRRTARQVILASFSWNEVIVQPTRCCVCVCGVVCECLSWTTPHGKMREWSSSLDLARSGPEIKTQTKQKPYQRLKWQWTQTIPWTKTVLICPHKPSHTKHGVKTCSAGVHLLDETLSSQLRIFYIWICISPPPPTSPFPTHLKLKPGSSQRTWY